MLEFYVPYKSMNSLQILWPSMNPSMSNQWHTKHVTRQVSQKSWGYPNPANPFFIILTKLNPSLQNGGIFYDHDNHPSGSTRVIWELNNLNDPFRELHTTVEERR